MKASHSLRPVFDDANLLAHAGLVPVLGLADAAGLPGALAGLSVPAANAPGKLICIVAGMLAGADSIDDLDLLRHGAMPTLFDGVRAPSTLGTFLRSFTHGHVQQLDRAGAHLLAGLAATVPGLVAQPARTEERVAFIDVDDTVREVHGYAKQAAAYGYTGTRGLNVQLAALSTPAAAPVITRARLRAGNTASATGVGRLLAQAVRTARAALAAGGAGEVPVVARADSAYYGYAFVGTAIRHQVTFSVTARMTATVKAAISAIAEDAWNPIHYPNAVFDEDEGRWVSDAEVAEVPFTAFTGRRKAEHVPCRLVVRRVKRLSPLTNDGSAQGELFATWRHHAFITNAPTGGPDALDTLAADQRHRDHAVIEQVIAEVKDGPLTHLPSGRYAANAAWVAATVIAFNLARAAAVAAGMARVRWASLRNKIVAVPARLATSGRRRILHLPRHWPWASAWEQLWTTATSGSDPPRHAVT